MTTNLPPHSAEAERAVIGAIFLDPDALDDVGPLAPADFYVPAYRAIFEACRKVAVRGAGVDALMVFDAAQASGAKGITLADLTDIMEQTPSSENVAYWAERVRDYALCRRGVAVCDEHRATLWRGHGVAVDLVGDAEAAGTVAVGKPLAQRRDTPQLAGRCTPTSSV